LANEVDRHLGEFRDRLGRGLTVGIDHRRRLIDRGAERLNDVGMVFGELARGGVKDDRIVAGQVGLEIGRFLESGDTVELSVDRIGVLKNTVLRQA
jgi:hypothetical protein